MAKVFRVRLEKSLRGCTETQRRTIEVLGLRKRLSTAIVKDNAANRGQIMKVQHLVSVKVEIKK